MSEAEIREVIDASPGPFWVTYSDGRREKRRLFVSTQGSICHKAKGRRKYGYPLRMDLVSSIEPVKSRKTEEQKWRDGWLKVKARLDQSGLWENIVEEITSALDIGYEKLQIAGRLAREYGDRDKELCMLAEIDQRFVYVAEEGCPHMRTGLLWHYTSSPRVKKMVFRPYILQGIAMAMASRTSYDAAERGQYDRPYDRSFEYKPEVNKAWYSEEYRGTGNGHYYLALDGTHALFYEDD